MSSIQQSSKASHLFRRNGRIASLNSEINITPFVDVMLVLLIIFMVTSPMLISGIEVELPKTISLPISENSEPLVISIDKFGKLYIQENLIDLYSLEAKLSAILNAKPETKIFIRGDKAINYEKVVELFSLIKKIGFSQVALVTEVD